MDSPAQTLIIHEPLYKIDTQLGEGPLYDPQRDVLHFVDVGKNTVHHLDIKSGNLSTDYYSDCITSLAFRKNGQGLIAIAREGLAVIEYPTTSRSSPQEPHKLNYICENPIPASLRDVRMFNDSAIDQRGRLFAGSKTLRGQPFLEETRPGRFYKVEKAKDGVHWVSEEVEAIGHCVVPNGAGFSPDSKTFYVADTRAFKVYAFDYNLGTGDLSNRRVFAETPWEGRPDGLTIDAEGYVWVAKYSGAKVTRYNPQGNVALEVLIPRALNITSVYFGGPARDILYITSGSLNESGEDGDAEKVRRYPHSGSVFAIKIPGVTGVDKPPFDG